MDAIAGEAVEVGGQRGDEGLALAGLHLGDPTEVQCGTAHQLDVVVALADGASGGFTAHGEGLEQEIVEIGAVVEPLSELDRLGLECVVGQCRDLGLPRVDLRHHPFEGLELLAFTGPEDAIENSHAASDPTGARTLDGSGRDVVGDRLQVPSGGSGSRRHAGRRGGNCVQPDIGGSDTDERRREPIGGWRRW